MWGQLLIGLRCVEDFVLLLSLLSFWTCSLVDCLIILMPQGFQAATNIALDLDERPMPKGPTFPRLVFFTFFLWGMIIPEIKSLADGVDVGLETPSDNHKIGPLMHLLMNE
jgi:hypothetical protein